MPRGEHRSELTGPVTPGSDHAGCRRRLSQNGVGSQFADLNFDRERFAEAAIEGARQGCVAIGPTLGNAEQCAAFPSGPARTASVRRTARGMQRGAPHAGGGCPVPERTRIAQSGAGAAADRSPCGPRCPAFCQVLQERQNPFECQIIRVNDEIDLRRCPDTKHRNKRIVSR